MDHHLGYKKSGRSQNLDSRNGYKKKKGKRSSFPCCQWAYRVGGKFYRISRPLTPPCVPFGTRRFFSFHKFAGNSWSWAYSLDWLFLS